MKTAPAIAALALAAATSAPLGAQSASQEPGVEIITGTRPAAALPNASLTGIRVVSYVSFDPPATENRVVEPLLPAEVLAVQQALVGLGRDPGLLDGQLGPAVRAALRAHQASRGLNPCGCVNFATVQSLGLRTLVVQTVVGEPPGEGAGVEVIVAPTLPRVAPAPAPAVPVTDTVYVAVEDQWFRGAWLAPFPVLVGGESGPVRAPPAGVRGLPIGGSGPMVLGRAPSTVRTTRPPPRR